MNEVRSSLLKTSVFTVGASCVLTQLVLLREMLALAHGNELVLGVLLGNWFLLTGAGTMLGRVADHFRKPVGWLVWLQLAVAVTPILQVLLLRAAPGLLLVRGAEPGALDCFVGSLAILAPFCLASGSLLPVASRILDPRAEARGVGRIYVADSLGSIAGGVAFSLLLVPWLDHVAMQYLPAAANLLVAGVIAHEQRARLPRAAAAILLAGCGGLACFTDLDAASTRMQFPGQQVLLRRNSPYGRLVVVDSAGQLSFLLNGLPIAASQSPEDAEETVHCAMAQRPEARRVLLIAGGISGTTLQILKYPVQQLTYVELDPRIIDAARRHLPHTVTHPRIRLVNDDGRRYVEHSRETFDVILIDIPEPTTAQLNRFFTVEFLRAARRILTPGGVVAFAAGHYENYVSDELARIVSSCFRTAKAVFPNVLLLPVGRVLVLASDGGLTTDIATVLEQRRIPTIRVNRNFLRAMLAPDRLADMRRAAATTMAPNRDFSPTLYQLHLRQWSRQYEGPKAWVGVLAGLGLLGYLWMLRPVTGLLFASGFAASSLQVILLLGFQILYGSLYQQVGLLVTVFMAGLAAGATAVNRGWVPPRRDVLGWLSIGLAAWAVAVPVGLRAIEFAMRGGMGGGVGVGGIALLAFGLAMLVGMQLPLGAATEPGPTASVAGKLYAADFIGAWLGALLTGAWLIPALGLTLAVVPAVGLNLGAAVAIWLAGRRT